MGRGTRSSPEKPNVSAFADMKGMDPTMMGGMKTSHGPGVLTSLAVTIPVLDEETLSGLKIPDHNIPLPVSDVNGRTAHTKVNYGHIWEGTDRARAERLCTMLKNRILKHEFTPTQMLEPL